MIKSAVPVILGRALKRFAMPGTNNCAVIREFSAVRESVGDVTSRTSVTTTATAYNVTREQRVPRENKELHTHTHRKKKKNALNRHGYGRGSFKHVSSLYIWIFMSIAKFRAIGTVSRKKKYISDEHVARCNVLAHARTPSPYNDSVYIY